MTIESERQEYRALSPSERRSHPSHRVFLALSFNEVDWLASFDPSLAAADLAGIPKSHIRAMYENILNYGPNGDKVAKLLKALNGGLTGNPDEDDEATQDFVLDAQESATNEGSYFQRTIFETDPLLRASLYRAAVNLRVDKPFLETKRNTIEYLLCVTGFEKTFSEETDGWYAIQSFIPKIDKFLSGSA